MPAPSFGSDDSDSALQHLLPEEGATEAHAEKRVRRRIMGLIRNGFPRQEAFSRKALYLAQEFLR
eukprot:15312238-Alexandrium_andersonii.AAC.1